MTAGEQLIERGRLLGVEQALRRILLKQLRARFGELPSAVTARIEVASTDQLDRWFDQVLHAATLDQVLAGE